MARDHLVSVRLSDEELAQLLQLAEVHQTDRSTMLRDLVMSAPLWSLEWTSPEPAPRTPCPEGFHWIGQSFACCDGCGLPAWDHEGIATPDRDSPVAHGWKLKPWAPGEREACRAKWDRPQGADHG